MREGIILNLEKKIEEQRVLINKADGIKQQAVDEVSTDIQKIKKEMEDRI